MSIEDYIFEDAWDNDEELIADAYSLGEHEVLGETPKAIRVRQVGTRDSIWIPKSQLREPNECVKLGDRGELFVSSWLVEKLEEEDKY